MAKLVIDLTGRNGLAPKHFGDLGTQTQAPELRIVAQDGQLVQGVYNPSKYLGYNSPANKSTVSVSLDTTNDLIGSTIYDAVNHEGYFAERGPKIFTANNLNDLTLTEYLQIAADSTEEITITDLEIYQLNDIRRLFFCYKREFEDTDLNVGDIGIINLTEVLILELSKGTRSLATDE